ncbi:SCO family protein [Polaromonas sp.]|uniref:SCO family protein n=1 Tax=Polaromonas sp. TaxID=1869339 RepID=UPI00286D601B|nr:SCO family protein [Polaromonas sp.]
MHPFPCPVPRAPAFLLAALLAVAGWPAASAHQGPHAAPSASLPQDGAAVSRSMVQVRLPAVRVRQHNGKLVAFDATMDDTRPVLLNFVFTTCTGICLPMSQLFAAAQERLGAQADQLQMVSVSIDPGQDTPARLAEYAGRFAAGPQWTFDTGSQDAIDAIQRAFNVYRPDKMSHTPVTFVRPRGSRQWVRLDGFPSPDQLIREAQAHGQGQAQATASP